MEAGFQLDKGSERERETEGERVRGSDYNMNGLGIRIIVKRLVTVVITTVPRIVALVLVIGITAMIFVFVPVRMMIRVTRTASSACCCWTSKPGTWGKRAEKASRLGPSGVQGLAGLRSI